MALRVFERGGCICQNCRRELSSSDKKQCDHIVAIINGGQNRESNLQTLCDWCHKAKTKADVALKSKVYRVKAKSQGFRGRRRTIPGRKFDGTPIPARWVNG
ncbi:HNH endonuclease [Afipia sp. TerB]